MEERNNDIGEYLSKLRKGKNLTLSDVAKILKLSTGYISRIERGSSFPSQEVLNKLCNIYGIDSIEILDEDDLEGLDLEKENVYIGEDIVDLMSSKKLSYKGRVIGIQDKIHLSSMIQSFLEIEDLDVKNNVVAVLDNLYKIANKNLK